MADCLSDIEFRSDIDDGISVSLFGSVSIDDLSDAVEENISGVVDNALDGFVIAEGELCVHTQCAHVINATQCENGRENDVVSTKIVIENVM